MSLKEFPLMADQYFPDRLIWLDFNNKEHLLSLEQMIQKNIWKRYNGGCHGIFN